jgi:hypothetical protein
MTAVQQVFSDLEKLQPHLFNMHSVEGREFVNHFHKYLAVEKEQMTLCYKVGVIDGNNGEVLNFEQYYNKTYKSEQ